MKNFRRALVATLLLALALATPARAVDPTLAKIIEYISIALGEPALKDAVPLIECVKDKGAATCFDVAGMAQSEGKKAVKQFMPDDPKVKAAVDIIKAAYAQDYLKVLEIGGVKLLPPLGCGLVFQVPEPVKGLVCNEQVFNKVSSLSGPVFKQLIVTIKNPSAGNLWGLVTVMDTKLACTVVKATVGNVPGLDEVCGPLGEVIEFAKDVGAEAIKAGKEAGKFLLDTGEAIVKGVGGAVEGACEGIGLCDGDGKKLMSADQYYKYRLFPRIHDRVVARLAKGQQDLGHDPTSLKACLSYYLYDFYKTHMPSVAPKVKQSCDGLGARLHKDAHALAQAFAAAPQAYFDASVKGLVSAYAVEGYGQNKLASYRKSVVGYCLTSMRNSFPIPEPTQPGATAWGIACDKVGGLFQTAYLAEEQKLAGTMQQLGALGCVKEQKSVYVNYKLACSTYEGFQACKLAHDGKLPCSLDMKEADTALADAILKQLGTKRCKIQDEFKTVPCPKKDGTLGACPQAGKHILCSRPWKLDQCKDLLAKLAGSGAANSAVKCEGDAAGLAAFAKLEGQASTIINKLNGGGGVIGTKEGLGNVKGKASAGSGSCKTTWDPLVITCPGGEHLAHPEISLPACAADPQQDGADQACQGGPPSMKMAREAIARAVVEQDQPVASFTPPSAPGPAGSARITREQPLPPFRSAPGLLDAGRTGPAPAIRDTPSFGTGRLMPATELAPGGGSSPAGQADLMPAPRIEINGRPAAWGGTVALDGSGLGQGRAGGCEVAIRSGVLNAGTAAGGPYTTAWRVGGRPAATRQRQPLSMGATDMQTEQIVLRPGLNMLDFVVDSGDQVREANEGNNQARVSVNLARDCEAGASLRAPVIMRTPALAPFAVPAMPAAPTMAIPPAPEGSRAAPRR